MSLVPAPVSMCRRPSRRRRCCRRRRRGLVGAVAGVDHVVTAVGQIASSPPPAITVSSPAPEGSRSCRPAWMHRRCRRCPDRIVATAGGDGVVAAVAIDGVVPLHVGDPVVACPAGDVVVPGPAGEGGGRVIAGADGDAVVAAAGVHVDPVTPVEATLKISPAPPAGLTVTRKSPLTRLTTTSSATSRPMTCRTPSTTRTTGRRRRVTVMVNVCGGARVDTAVGRAAVVAGAGR